MASAAYYDWINKGSPFTLAYPCADLQKALQAAGYTVYAYPNRDHLLAEPPEDHTPFSATGWPIVSPFGYGHAIDIMPRTGPMSIADLARRIIAQKRANVPGTRWIKYLNWTDESGVAYHVSWQPDYASRSSSDKGHIHISGRSDCTRSTEVRDTGWNPLTGAGTMTQFSEDDKTVLRAAPWQYAGRGIGENDETAEGNRSTLSYFDEVLDNTREIKRDVASLGAPVGGQDLVEAFMAALAASPSTVDAIATAVASRIGMIPTAREIAAAIGGLNWHGTAGS